MATWREFSEQQPEMAEGGRQLLYQFGVGLAFLATIRPDTGPRVHPMCPILHDDRLFAFILPSPKLNDLRRDGRYALHCFPPPDNEDAFYVTGRARIVDDAASRAAVSDRFLQERVAQAIPAPEPDHVLVELDLDTALLTRTTGHGDFDPQHTVWKARRPSP